LKKFIEAFKKTSYYKELFNSSSEILAIFMLGSMSTGIIDEDSDYDIVIITLDGAYIDSSKYEHLKYMSRKVHWYYKSIKDLFDAGHNYGMRYIGMMQIRNICKDLIIYENPKYINILHRLYCLKDIIGNAGMYGLFNSKRSLVNDILTNGKILEKHYTKFLYHLCLASYYLMEEEPDKDFLRELKSIKLKPVSDEYKQLAVERLKLCKTYIETNDGINNINLQAMYMRCIQDE
jgi:hypothetical protein